MNIFCVQGGALKHHHQCLWLTESPTPQPTTKLAQCSTHMIKARVLTWHDGLLAFLALGRVLVGIAVSAQQLLLLGSKRLIHQ